MTLSCLQGKGSWDPQSLSFFPYQVRAAERAVDDLEGRAILADEVGLGKTIEAGLISRELIARGRIKNILILTPAGLVDQWESEFKEKFRLPDDATKVNILSIDRAKRPPLSEELLQPHWDLLIVDEAHLLKNRTTANYQFVSQLNYKYVLLLSATPLQNDLTELYSLVSLVKPDLFGSYIKFQSEFLLTKRIPRKPKELRRLLDRVLIRYRRSELEGVFPSRRVALLPLDLKPEERALYDEITDLVRKEYRLRLNTQGSILPLITLQRQACSSAAAIQAALEGGAGDWLGDRRNRLLLMARSAARKGAKMEIVESLILQLNEPVIIFTEFRASQNALSNYLRRTGISCRMYHGELNARERQQTLREFRELGGVLISTESGGQGLNLQTARHVVNYDLPWNPMRIEQRIGRVHRIGQQRDVCIYNLCAQETIEEYVLRMLDEKIDLFRNVIGELDIILRHFEQRRSIEARVLEIAATARNRNELNRRFEQLGEQILRTRREVQTSLA